MSKILGVKIDELKFSDVMRRITDFLSSNEFHQIATVNPEFIIATRKDDNFKKILNETDINIPDGFGLQCAAFFKQIKIGERITGVDLTMEIAKIASEGGYSIYFLGGKKGVAEMTAQRLRYLYRNLKIAGTYAGSPDEVGLIDKILQTKPDILLVAYGAPKQEKFIAELKVQSKELNASSIKISMGVGGTFDFITGHMRRAPKWMRKIGLEWLYRLFKQPSRIKRIYNAVIYFPLLVIFSK